ncbi:hypothetical protein J6590_008584 [Homalodisca vitripennis]|nr:hypothetical protein J6590_008584 [Homalodisca vitripennis]
MLPNPRNKVILDYSRWQQHLIGVLQFDIAYHPNTEMAPRTIITLDAKLGYRNKGDADGDWKYFTSSVVQRILDCSVENTYTCDYQESSYTRHGYVWLWLCRRRKTDEQVVGVRQRALPSRCRRVKTRERYYYNCSFIPLFELGSLFHDYYLLNIRLPVDHDKGMNLGLGHIEDIWLVAINQTGGFTKVWMSMKLVFFPSIVAIMIWFWNRVHQLTRAPLLLENMLLFLGSTLTFLNMPLELLTLFYDLPFMLLLSDIREGIFYAALLSFWLVFAGEHLMESQKNHLRGYWKHLSGVAIGCVSLFVFDVCERGAQLRNPFYSIWVTDVGTHLALTFIILAGISAGMYFLFLSYMIWQVFCNISAKRASLPSMSSLRRLHYEGIIYRFKFLMLATLLCAAMTVIGFILNEVSEGRWKWDEDLDLEYTSAFFTGVYGMWNIYIFALIVLYAPSHKQWPSEHDISNINDEIEFSRLPTDASEISALTTFVNKASID